MYPDADDTGIMHNTGPTHAELESYIEQACITKVDKILARAASGTAHERLARMSLRYAEKLKAQPHKSLPDLAKACHALFLSDVSANNGIKSDQVERLLLTVGVPQDAWQSNCAVLVAALDAFASLRGEIAHVGAKSLTVDPYPSNARSATKAILDELPPFHSLVARL